MKQTLEQLVADAPEHVLDILRRLAEICEDRAEFRQYHEDQTEGQTHEFHQNLKVHWQRLWRIVTLTANRIEEAGKQKRQLKDLWY